MSKNKIKTTLKARRKALRVTQEHVAELAQISVNTLYKIERGQANPRLETLMKIADVLGLELSLQVKTIQNSKV